MRRLWFTLATLLAGAGSAWAQATPLCSTLPNPVWLQIGDTQEPLIKELGKRLRESTTNPFTFIYVTSGSCTNTAAIYAGTKITINPKFIPTQTEVPGWTTAMTSPSCMNDATGHDIDIANSNVFIEACAGQTKPNNIEAIMGPIQPYVFAVPEQSLQTAITAEEAFFVFGYANGTGMASPSPWDLDTFKFTRPMDKSTLVSIAANIKLPVDKWHGNPQMMSGMVVTMLVASGTTMPEKAIGILGAEIYDKNRLTLNALAFKGFKQTKAYYPDSTANARDKRTTRDGHYMIWSPTVYLAKKVMGTGQISAKARTIIDLILGKDVTPAPGFDSLESVVTVGLVPDCAMHVARCAEGQDMKPYSSATPCDCYFESVATMTATPPGCTSCATTPCATGVCRRGFCEAR
jgi:hypothetical protein